MSAPDDKLEKIRRAKEALFETGRFKKQFENLGVIGKGGFGTVMKAVDRLEDQTYAVKKVRLHLPLTDDLRSELRNHRVFREVLALSDSKIELTHTVRYYSKWIEDLDPEEQQEEERRLKYYNERRRLSSVSESHDSGDTGTRELNSKSYYDSEEEAEEYSEEQTETGALESHHSLVCFDSAQREYLSVNLFI